MPGAGTPSRLPQPTTPAKPLPSPRPATALGFGRFTPSLPLSRPAVPRAPKSPYHTTTRLTPHIPPSPPSHPARPKSRLDSISSLVRSASRLGRNANTTWTPKRQMATAAAQAMGESPMSPPVIISHPSRPSPIAARTVVISATNKQKDGQWAAVHLEWAEYDEDLTRDQKIALDGAECLGIRDPWEEFNPDKLRARFLLGKPKSLPPLPPNSIAMVPLAPPQSPTLPRAFASPPPTRPAGSFTKNPLPAPRSITRKPVPSSAATSSPPSTSTLPRAPQLAQNRPARLSGPRPMIPPSTSTLSRSPQSAASTSPVTPPLSRLGLASPTPPFARPLSQQVAGKMSPVSPKRTRAPWR